MILKSICIDIDKNKIIKGIDEYYKLAGEKPHYMIMNRESEYLLRKKEDFQFSRDYIGTGFSTLYGVPIAICEKLETGVVDFV